MNVYQVYGRSGDSIGYISARSKKEAKEKLLDHQTQFSRVRKCSRFRYRELIKTHIFTNRSYWRSYEREYWSDRLDMIIFEQGRKLSLIDNLLILTEIVKNLKIYGEDSLVIDSDVVCLSMEGFNYSIDRYTLKCKVTGKKRISKEIVNYGSKLPFLPKGLIEQMKELISKRKIKEADELFLSYLEEELKEATYAIYRLQTCDAVINEIRKEMKNGEIIIDSFRKDYRIIRTPLRK